MPVYIGLLFDSVRGTIPSELGLLTNLGKCSAASIVLLVALNSYHAVSSKQDTILLQDNLLTGTIPTELGSITNPGE
jgi:hypothetical protein